MSRMASASMRQGLVARPFAAASMAKSSGFQMMRAGAASFSTTTSRRAAAAADGETDDELSAKIESEIQIEEEMKASEQEPSSVKDFIDNSPFELIDTPGQEVVKLVRNFGEEKCVFFFPFLPSPHPFESFASTNHENAQNHHFFLHCRHQQL